MGRSIYDTLRRRYPANEYALLEEVSDAAGFHASRSADFILMNLWPSRGLHLNGIELKSHRSDWLSEMKKPQKAENIFQFCDYFWLLTSDEAIAKIEEIPEAWGWMTVKGEKIFVKKEAPKLKPLPIDRHFLAALLKRASDKTNFVHIESIEERIERATQSGRDEAKRSIQRSEDELKRILQKVKEFETASGIDLDFRWGYNQAQIAKAIKLLITRTPDELRNDLIRLKETSEKISNQIAEGIETLTELTGGG